MNASALSINLNALIEIRHRVREVQIFSSPNKRSPLIGLHRAKLRGRGVDFDQVRIYQPGDDVRTIDWRVTARTQEPHTKLFHEERERPIFIIAEQSMRLYFGSALSLKSVLAAQAAALFGWAALGHNDRVGGLVITEQSHLEVRPRRHKQALLQFLNRLAEANQQLPKQTSAQELLAPALRRAREVLRPGSLVILICDERALTAPAEQQLSFLARHIDIVLMPVSDPLDHALPNAGWLSFAQGKHHLTLDTHQDAIRAEYAANAQARQLHWQQLAKKMRLPLLPLSTEFDLIEQLRQLLNTPTQTPAYESVRA